ncbi:MAG TPA: hypothetical protein VF153_05885 [Candidatus Limnocylindria bacterium]
MPKATRRDADSRADARRRSRQIERGDDVEELESDPVEPAGKTAARPRPNLLSSIFPPAPPLPGKPDPLAGFTYSGPLRAQVAWLWLLANNPRAWLLPAIPWAAAQTLTMFTPIALPRLIYQMTGVLAALAAGWIGWQKPWLFGLATALAGSIIQGIFLALVPGNFARGTAFEWFNYAIVVAIAQLSLLYAALMGWYAGYFRRRLAAQRTSGGGGRQRRR